MSRDFKEPCALKRAAAAERTRKSRAARSPEKVQASRARKRDYDRKAMYGVTVAEIEQHLAEQGGGCKICKTALSIDTFGTRTRKGKPHVDHCHTTGAFRGILCHLCNIGLGHFRDNPAALTAAIEYLSNQE